MGNVPNGSNTQSAIDHHMTRWLPIYSWWWPAGVWLPVRLSKMQIQAPMTIRICLIQRPCEGNIVSEPTFALELKHIIVRSIHSFINRKNGLPN